MLFLSFSLLSLSPALALSLAPSRFPLSLSPSPSPSPPLPPAIPSLHPRLYLRLQVGGGTLLAHCYPDAKAPETAQKVNGWGPFFVSTKPN